MTESAIPTEIHLPIEDWLKTCPRGGERIAFIACRSEGSERLRIITAFHSTSNTMVYLFKDLFKDDDLRAAAILALTGGPND